MEFRSGGGVPGCQEDGICRARMKYGEGTEQVPWLARAQGTGLGHGGGGTKHGLAGEVGVPSRSNKGLLVPGPPVR